MLPIYEETGFGLTIYQKPCTHSAPHLHRSIEFVFVTKGELAIGVGQNLYQMNEGDFALVFPETVHHYQVFAEGINTACYILASPGFAPAFQSELLNLCPKEPVIPKEMLHPDIKFAINAICEEFASGKEKQSLDELSKQQNALAGAYINILLSRSLSYLSMVPKKEIGAEDLIYKTVSYISANFANDISLTSMAHDLGVSQYTLSRVFSKTFHRNFNQYVNEGRLDYAQTLLRYTDKQITEICYEAGFESQRTFNRSFVMKYHMSPREYRKNIE
jgi:AraC-like DNA-binding protein